MTPRAPITVGIVLIFIHHILSISRLESLCFEFSVTLVEMFLSVGITILKSMQLFIIIIIVTIIVIAHILQVGTFRYEISQLYDTL